MGLVFSVWLGGVGDWLAPWLSLRAAGFGGFVARPLLGRLVALQWIGERWCRVMRVHMTHVEYCTVACQWAGVMVHRVRGAGRRCSMARTRGQRSSSLPVPYPGLAVGIRAMMGRC